MWRSPTPRTRELHRSLQRALRSVARCDVRLRQGGVRIGLRELGDQHESANATNTKDLAPFAWTYVPDANGAAGGYYIDANVTPYSNSEVYGAKQ